MREKKRKRAVGNPGNGILPFERGKSKKKERSLLVRIKERGKDPTTVKDVDEKNSPKIQHATGKVT